MPRLPSHWFPLVLSEGLRPSDSPTRSLARRFAGALRSRGSLAMLARTLERASGESVPGGGHPRGARLGTARGPRRALFARWGGGHGCSRAAIGLNGSASCAPVGAGSPPRLRPRSPKLGLVQPSEGARPEPRASPLPVVIHRIHATSWCQRRFVVAIDRSPARPHPPAAPPSSCYTPRRQRPCADTRSIVDGRQQPQV